MLKHSVTEPTIFSTMNNGKKVSLQSIILTFSVSTSFYVSSYLFCMDFQVPVAIPGTHLQNYRPRLLRLINYQMKLFTFTLMLYTHRYTHRKLLNELPVGFYLFLFYLFKHLSHVAEFVITFHIDCIGELEKGAPKVFKKR